MELLFFSFKLEDERPITKITRGTFLIKEGNQIIPKSQLQKKLGGLSGMYRFLL